ncbi:glyoxalase [Sphingorhabdus lutea]|uniref:Glyoxalase n=1 Tax=Sphingorhabdus lutea TaxID=1913578 RepID=A0A1L3J9G1_9SPHN|nr:VOC family protein [Sphingorhabdus lutea]APG61782.1 glyoxalase [Sphingorhabdus lutea]
MIGYITLGTNDIERARAFYSDVLGELGAKELMRFELNGFTMYGPDFEQPSLAVTLPFNGAPHQVGNGQMAGLIMQNRAMVDKMHAKVLSLGGADEGAPGIRGEEGDMAFYGAYCRDLDGNKLCFFAIGPAS